MNLKKYLKKKLPSNAYPEYLKKITTEELSLIAHAKRFKERYTADPEFRELVAINSVDAAKKYGIKINPEEIRPIWDPITGKAYAENNLPISNLLRLCIEHDKALIDWSTRHRDGETITNPNFKLWRQQQIARSNSEIGVPLNSKIVHAPVCFELSSGCTVGCWFCAISADKFTGAFTYSPENKKLWNDVLKVVREITGKAAQGGFCYWATDPFDNPDYEQFIRDYHSVFSGLPATNSSMSHKDIPRTRSLINMWKNYGFTCNHLSILTVSILNKIHQEFTPEELVWTNLNLVNKQSTVKKATAGRAREKLIKLSHQPEELEEIKTELSQGTIACVSGFLFNMVEKKVQLITPCKASDLWPKGYMSLDQGTFTNGKDLRTLLQSMIENNMPLTLDNDSIIKFRSDLQYEPLVFGFKLMSDYQTQKIENPRYGKELGQLINAGSHTIESIIESICKLGATQEEITMSIDALYKNGLLENQLSANTTDNKSPQS